jgi:raffinose/stachyose/melibiose transport system permease protein
VDQYRRDIKVIVAFLALPLLIYVGLAVIPIIQALYFSVFDWPGIQGVPLEFVGLQNFREMFSYGDFQQSLLNVLQFVVLNLVIQIPVGYGLALLLGNYLRGYRAFKVVFFLPVVLPMTATSLLWKFIYFPTETGVLNLIWSLFGGEPIAWLLEKNTALNSVIVANAWTGLGYHMVIGFAAISSIPEDILEAADIDGCIGLRKVWRIILPIVWEAMKISVALIIVGSLKNFDIIFIMTEGGPNGLTNVPATLMYFEAFRYFNYGLGSAIAAFIFIASVVLAVGTLRLMRREELQY